MKNYALQCFTVISKYFEDKKNLIRFGSYKALKNCNRLFAILPKHQLILFYKAYHFLTHWGGGWLCKKSQPDCNEHFLSNLEYKKKYYYKLNAL